MTPTQIREARRVLGLSQARFAQALPVAKRTLEDWERGIAKPPPYLARAIRDLQREQAKTPE